MNRGKLAGRLYLSTMGTDSQEMAEKLGLGLEIAEFCTAVNLERDTALYRDAVLKKQARLDRFWFHAPFAELSPAAVDPRVREVTALRYRQAIQMATGLGIHRLVIHSGFIPQVYFPEWFVPQSVLFWQTFLAKAPENITIALENVMDPGPEMLVEIVRQVNDPRLGLCLDVGHANCRISETPPLHWIEPMLPFLYHVHLHNNAGDMDLHAELGSGTVPMETILDILLARRPEATFTIENQICSPSLVWLWERGYLPNPIGR